MIIANNKERSAMIRRSALLLVLMTVFSVGVPSAYAKTASPLNKKVADVWGKNRGIKVIQRRVFTKSHRWEFGLFAGTMPNDEVWNYWPVGARIDYFIFESLGFELVGAYVPSSSTKLHSFLASRHLETQELEKVMYYGGVNFFWAPLHGKFSLFNHEVTHFDVGLNFGAGVMGTQTKQTANSNWEMATPSVYGEIGLGVQLYLTRSWALRIDYRHYFYPAAGGGTSMPAEFTVGFGWFTKAPH